MAEKRYWFKAKKYGWGWYPSSWQGWLVMLLWLAAFVELFVRADRFSHSASDTLINFIPEFIILAGSLIFICWKTGERPSWRWAGKPSAPRLILGWTVTFAAAFVLAALLTRFALFHLR